jgi:hypothetical protein
MRVFILVFVISYFSIEYAHSTPLLAALEIELDNKQTLPLASKISFEMLSPNAAAIAESLLDWQSISVNQIDDNTLAVSIMGKPKFTGEVAKQYTANSFVIDIDEESTKHFVLGFVNETKHPWTLDQIVPYVNRHIQEPTYIHGFNIASVVATQGSGDCTEYAVLTAALARALDIPARVVIGTVILEDKSQVTAFGHAWTEIWKNGSWQIIDAALYGSQASQLFYLPASALENESPGYTLSLAVATNLMPTKIKRVRNFN